MSTIDKLMNDDSLYSDISDNLSIALLFNNNCNCRCKFCHLRKSNRIAQNNDDCKIISEKFLYDDLISLYPKVSNIRTTFAEITACKEGYEYLKFINENYPHINVSIETNGIAFDEKWQKLACDNLMNVHFSLNAINDDYYKKTVWDKDGVYDVIQKNFRSYLQILEKKDNFEFKPSVSMVVNSTNYETINEFIKKYIAKGIQEVNFFFDVTEKNHYNIEDVIIELIELERVLSDKVTIVQLFTPVSDLSKYYNLVSKFDINLIKEKYSDVLHLADVLPDLDVLKIQKNNKQLKQGKKIFISDKNLKCQNPWRSITISPNGKISVCVCCESISGDYIQNYIKNGCVDWKTLFNSLYYRNLRYNFKKGNLIGCQPNCPGNL